MMILDNHLRMSLVLSVSLSSQIVFIKILSFGLNYMLFTHILQKTAGYLAKSNCIYFLGERCVPVSSNLGNVS